MRPKLPKCERCGNTIPKRYRDDSSFCSVRCWKSQQHSNRESWDAEIRYEGHEPSPDTSKGGAGT
jgi:hypothetical protein